MESGTTYKKSILILLCLLLVCYSCVDEYYPEIDKYDNLIVVDGLLTDSNDPAIVKLSISSPLYDEELIPLSNGDLYISDENQTNIPLSETEPGIYKVIDSSFQGQVGKTYQLHINLPDGRSYISDTCRLPEPSPIDSIYGIDEPSNIETGLPGIQFYVDNHSNSANTAYYLWLLSQTYEYRSSFEIDYTWEGEYIPYPKPDSLKTCWVTTDVKELFLTTAEYADPPVLTQFPLNFVATDTKLLSIKYSLLVKQLTIPKDAFEFYEAIWEQNDNQGSLWTQQPIQILGNMRNVNDAEEPVLGYFMVAGINEERIFVNRPELIFHYSECTPDFDLRFIPFEPKSAWPIYIDDIMFLGWAIADDEACFDCRLEGGSLNPPDFWE